MDKKEKERKNDDPQDFSLHLQDYGKEDDDFLAGCHSASSSPPLGNSNGTPTNNQTGGKGGEPTTHNLIDAFEYL
jgi:hypothetical protein